RALMLLAEFLDDLRAGGRLVAEHAAAGAVHERIDHVVRQALRVGRGGRLSDDAHQLPVARRRVLSLRALEQPARNGRGARLGAAAPPRLPVPAPPRPPGW